MIFVGISRKTIFSPNRESADTAIFENVASAIEKEGYDVVRMSESVLVYEGFPSQLAIDGIFHMARSVEALKVIEAAQDEGIQVINSVQAVLNCGRAFCAESLSCSGSPFVKSLVLFTDNPPVEWTDYPCWVKRGDAQSYFADDVRFVTSPDECAAVLKNLYARGVGKAVLSHHVPGRVIKFYGVSSGFFNWRMVSFDENSKFGLERHNDNHINPRFDVGKLTDICFSAASVLGLDVFGGDAVVSERGEITLVDFNDWPSFSGCRIEAALKISELIIDRSMAKLI